MSGPVRNEQGFAALVAEHFARAVRFCARMLGDLSEGEEVAQAAFVKLYEKGRDLSQTDGALPYLYRVLRNACIDHIRARRRALDIDEHDAPAPPDLAHADRAEVERALFDAVQALDAAQREVVLLRYYEGLELPQVAQATGQTIGATAMKLTRAKQKLRDKLGRLPAFKEYAGDTP